MRSLTKPPIKKTPIPKTKKSFYELYFRSTDDEVVDSVFYGALEDEKLPETLPDTTNDEKIIKVFRFVSKHHTYHFKVDCLEELERVGRYVLKMRYDENYYWKPEKEELNKTGFKSKEEIEEKMPKGYIRSMVIDEWEKYEKSLKDFDKLQAHWDELQKMLKGESTLGKIMALLHYYEEENFQIIDLDEPRD